MTRYVLRRLVQAIPVILFILVFNYALIQLAPGDPVSFLVGDFGATQAEIAALRARLGLDRSPLEQLGLYIASALRGDLGYSFYYSQPVSALIIERLPATLLLMGFQLIVSTLLGVILGMLAGRHQYERIDNVISGAAIAGYSIPVFWSAQMLLLLFAVRLKFLPAQGMLDVRQSLVGMPYVLDVLRHLALPALTLTLANSALLVRVTRAAVVDIMTEQYVVTARSKGLGEGTVLLRHVFRNALIPVVTVIGINLGHMLAGAALTETVFAWPGIGRLMYDAILRRDHPIMLGILLVSSVGVIFASLLTDLLYALVDPRIRLGRKSA